MSLTKDERLMLTTWLMEAGMEISLYVALRSSVFKRQYPATARVYFGTSASFTDLRTHSCIERTDSGYRITARGLDIIGEHHGTKQD